MNKITKSNTVIISISKRYKYLGEIFNIWFTDLAHVFIRFERGVFLAACPCTDLLQWLNIA